MRKKELLELKTLKATPKMMKMAADDTLETRELNNWGYHYHATGYKFGLYMRCRIINGILRVAFYFPKHMKTDAKLPAYEVFVNKEDRQFITYDRIENKWRTAKLDMLYWPDYVKNSEYKWISKKDNREMKGYLGTELDGYQGLLKYQRKIREERLEERYKRETASWDEDMAQVPPLPKDWDRWLGKVGIAEHFIFYRYSRKGATTGYCTYCEKQVPIRAPRHNKEGTCLCCRHNITFKATGKASMVSTRIHGVYLLQRCKSGFVIRGFRVYRDYRKDRYDAPVQYCWEPRRIICSEGGIPLRTYCFGKYKNRARRWIPLECYSPPHMFWTEIDESVPTGKVYGKTMPSLTKKELGHTGFPEYMKMEANVDPEDYLEAWSIVPQLEQLTKAGLGTLARECIKNPHGFSSVFQNARTGNLTKALGITTPALKRLRNNQGGKAFLEWLQYENQTKTVLPDALISWYCGEKISIGKLDFILDKMSPVQVKNYIQRQMAENDMRSGEVLTTWSDYLSMAKRLKMDTDDAIIFRVRKLKQRHDELVQRFHQKDFFLQAVEILKKYPHIEEIYESIKDTYGYAQEDYTVLVPSCIEDILLEGQNLHHCVGSSDRYWERIERQESYVLFLRRSSDLSKAYYTLEIEPDGTVRQKRTMFDRQEADIEDATKFLRKWQKELSRRITSKERDLAEKSRILRAEEFAQMREDQVIIHTGHLRGRLLVDVLMADLMENNEELTAEALPAAA